MVNVRSITIFSLALVACNQGQISSTGAGPGIDAGTIMPGPFDSPAPLCPPDPDCFAGGQCEFECPDFWTCELLSEGTQKRCTNPGPDLPGEGNWMCSEANGQITCTGNTFPSDGGGGAWNCIQMGDLVTCTNSTPDYPDQEADGYGDWNCYFSGSSRICDGTAGGNPNGPPGFGDNPGGGGPGGSTPDGGLPGGGDGDGGSGPGGGHPDDGSEDGCECIPSSTRFCHVGDMDSCIWGQAVCQPDGSWGHCNPAPETAIPTECRFNTVFVEGGGTVETFVGYDAACCVRMGFCCDNQDFDYSLVDPTLPTHASVGNCTNVCAAP